MPVTLRPIGHLKSMVHDQAELTVPAGISVREALVLAHIPSEMVALVVINGEHHADKDILLHEGDVVKVMAVIGGG